MKHGSPLTHPAQRVISDRFPDLAHRFPSLLGQSGAADRGANANEAENVVAVGSPFVTSHNLSADRLDWSFRESFICEAIRSTGLRSAITT